MTEPHLIIQNAREIIKITHRPTGPSLLRQMRKVKKESQRKVKLTLTHSKRRINPNGNLST